MAVTAAGLLADLAVARKTLNEWECGPITIDVCNSSSNDITKSINFTETIGHQRRVPKTGRRDDDNCYWLNAEWNRNDDDIRQTLIIPYFVSAKKLIDEFRQSVVQKKKGNEKHIIRLETYGQL